MSERFILLIFFLLTGCTTTPEINVAIGYRVTIQDVEATTDVKGNPTVAVSTAKARMDADLAIVPAYRNK